MNKHVKFWSQSALTSQFHVRGHGPGRVRCMAVRVQRRNRSRPAARGASRSVPERRVLGARGRARAAVGNAVAGRQVIVIGAAVPLCRGRPSRRAHAHSRPCVASPSVARTPLLLFTLASPFDPAPQPTLSIFAVRWVAPAVGAAPLGGGAGGGGRCTPFFF